MLADSGGAEDPATGAGAADSGSAAAGARAVLEQSRSSFGAAFVFLDKPRREALDAVYAFCRFVDDAVDDAPSVEVARDELAAWRRRIDGLYGGRPVGDAGALGDVQRALSVALGRFSIHREDLDAVIEGCEWDLTHRRYRTWEELREYCLRVASAVGLACIEIFGYHEARTREYAIDLGLALQLTNIIRDVDEDAARGRIYLPLEELADFNVSEQDLIAGRRTPERLRLMRYQARRAHLHFQRARAAISPRQRRELVAAEIMGDIYYKLLLRLEREGFPPGRVAISKPGKAAIALKRYALSRLLGPLR